ncbi:uncharacterized protein LY89DRAFT_738314 [Mollisia scopiformis]|uniref:Uncharacterized protein n=1 Tax=Mollisia scopiformis TaxID=149040 RepID=A0A194WY62_MOLSC|nr:uncharacterized protein LY89DRAFT_738314 [Mollisia scopiformis]KUJ12537.1 hypothetical protein LY89DRAFT_738314 [Mollisia scopiformis]
MGTRAEFLGEYSAIGGSSALQIRSGETVADEMERWIRISDVDGFNAGHVVAPQAWVDDVIDILISVSEKRGGLVGMEEKYSVPGGTRGASRLRPLHPRSAFKFDVLQNTSE